MKILHLSNDLGAGGSEKLLTDILPLMKAEGHEVALAIANSAQNLPAFEATLKSAGVPVYNFRLPTFSPLLVYRLLRLLRRERYDIVHAHIFPTQYWLALTWFLKPRGSHYVKTEHNVHNNRRKRWLRPLEKRVYRAYEVVVAITGEVGEALQQWLEGGARLQVIPNGVNLQQIRAMQAAASPYLFLKPGQYHVLMTGRFNGKAKDQATLIRAFQHLPERFQLYFAGGGEDIDAARALVQALKLGEQVHFLGLRADVYALMQAVDLNVLSTRYEGLSGVTLEGMASGKPFIGSQVKGVQELVPDERFLFPPENPEALSEKILQLANDPALSQAMVQSALAHVQRYDIRRMMQQYLELYQQLSLCP